jgi:hypothetical protein
MSRLGVFVVNLAAPGRLRQGLTVHSHEALSTRMSEHRGLCRCGRVNNPVHHSRKAKRAEAVTINHANTLVMGMFAVQNVGSPKLTNFRSNADIGPCILFWFQLYGIPLLSFLSQVHSPLSSIDAAHQSLHPTQ